MYKETYRIGDKFLHTLTGDVYILAATGGMKMGLICLNDGALWDEPFDVEDASEVNLVASDKQLLKHIRD